MISELEHCLKVARSECETLTQQNSDLVKQLADAVALQLETQGKNEKIRREIDHIWSVLRGEIPEVIVVDELQK
jgi:hypothetical protein